ncbi:MULTISPECIES: hypothetical protein [unclassified Neorhizobium]|uniref:hypothetical protein n=1 Tax=unclassified Neorhizobium TaxID=2629175 RepID=UPI001FF37D6A|nr:MULTISPECIES: hypothetical protein [unclassified Neorhizobium]MCJ9672013.1 hypothetical protein [Neorhizobium sp. SHOUNA12B]MCJ9747945.1 hypothetical protein [Neorhizobium sp. SHOUNA12A]
MNVDGAEGGSRHLVIVLGAADDGSELDESLPVRSANILERAQIGTRYSVKVKGISACPLFHPDIFASAWLLPSLVEQSVASDEEPHADEDAQRISDKPPPATCRDNFLAGKTENPRIGRTGKAGAAPADRELVPSGNTLKDAAKSVGISDQTYCLWKTAGA